MNSSPGTLDGLRFAAGMFAGVMLLAVPVSILSLTALAGDERGESAFRLYFAIPFTTAREREPARLGFQLMYEDEDAVAYTPLRTGGDLETALDLGFTRNGLARLDVNGADARGAYETFARAIGLTPEEADLCREADCLDWVKQAGTSVSPASRPGE